jgi:hypothetical protein
MPRYKVNPVPHSHYIIQWLEGKVVQVRVGDTWEDVPFNEKGNIAIPIFWASQEYRLIPGSSRRRSMQLAG